MSLENDLARESLKGRYASLKEQLPHVVAPVQAWADEAMALRSRLADPAEQAEVLALRDSLVAQINAALGVTP